MDLLLSNRAMQLNLCGDIVHYHPNNYSNAQDYAGIRIFPLGEFTFIRKDRVSNTFGYESLPNILDMVNVPGKKAKSLPKNVFFE